MPGLDAELRFGVVPGKEVEPVLEVPGTQRVVNRRFFCS